MSINNLEKNVNETSSNIFISIGYNCDPRIVIKNKYNMTNNNGYKSCPFDLCITSFEALYNCIDTDFSNFFDLELIDGCNADGNRNMCGKGLKNIKNAYGIVFNHEGSTHSHMFNEGRNDDEFYIRNNFEQFKKRYLQRIQNYRDYINNNNNITFLYNTNYDDTYNYPESSISKFVELCNKKYVNKNITVCKV